MDQLLVKNAIVPGFGNGQTSDVAVRNGRIREIADCIDRESYKTIHADGKLLVPGFVDIHTHLEKTFTYDTATSNSSLGEISISFADRLKLYTHEDIIMRACKAVEMAVANGTTAMRTHLVVNKSIGLKNIEAVSEVKNKYENEIDLELVAMAGITSDDKMDNESIKILEEACQFGSDLLGGAPTLCKNPYTVIDQIFSVARSNNLPIDFHIDEMDEASAEVLEYLAEKTIREHMQGMVTAGHCTSLAAVSDEIATRVIEKVKYADITVVTLPTSNIYLMGRTDKQPIRRGLTRVKELTEAGVNVCYANDNVRDPFVPFGNYDMLDEGLTAAKLLQMGTFEQLEEIFRMGTSKPAAAMGLKDYEINVGSKADFVILDAANIPLAILTQADKNYVVKNGRIVFQSCKLA